MPSLSSIERFTMTVQEEAVLDPYTMRNKPSTLHFVSEEARARAVFSKMDDDLKDKLEKKPLAMENHKVGHLAF